MTRIVASTPVKLPIADVPATALHRSEIHPTSMDSVWVNLAPILILVALRFLKGDPFWGSA